MTWEKLGQRDHDIAAGWERGQRARWHDAGRVVFLEEQRAAAPGREIGAPQDRRVDPAGRTAVAVAAEIGRARRRRRGLGAARTQALGNAGALAQALSHDLDGDELDPLPPTRAAAAGPFRAPAARPPPQPPPPPPRP